jgi:hypothetical protein
MAHEGAPVEGDPQLLVSTEDQPDAGIDHVDDDLAEQQRTWEADWGETLTEVQKWGPRFAAAYRDAREAAGGTVKHQYDGEGEPVGFSATEAKAFKMQPDVLIVDLSMHGRSLRHPMPGDVNEKVFAAGWTVLRREFPAPEGAAMVTEEDEADKEPKKAPAKRKLGGLLDELVEIDAPEEDEAAVDEASGEPVVKRNMFVERIVVTHDGRIIRFVGRSDANPEGEGPLRFARVRPDETLKDEDDEDAGDDEESKGKSKYEKQKKQLEDYMEDNDDHFVPREQFNAKELLSPSTIAKAELNSLPQDAPEGAEDYELQAWMVREGLADFLEKRGLAEPDYLADLRA